MALVFPRDMPACPPGDVPFFLRRNEARAVAGYGSPQVTELAPAQWRGRWTFSVRESLFYEWAAWLASLRGGLRTFKGRPRRRWPQAHPRGFAGMIRAAGGVFDGVAVVSAIGTSRDTATLTGLPLNFELRPGDHFSVPAGARQHLHRITEGGAAVAGSLGVTFEPVLRPNVAADAPALLDGPWCDMVLAAEHTESVGRGVGAISFEGLQVLV